MQTCVDTKIERLDKLWNELVPMNPSLDQLWNIIRLVPELRHRAWQAYCATNPSEETLKQLLLDRYARNERHYPERLLIERFPSGKTLRHLISDTFSHLRCEAAQKLLELFPSNDNLMFILTEIREEEVEGFLDKVADKLMEQSLTEDELITVVSRSRKNRMKAAQLLSNLNSLGTTTIRYLLTWVPSLVPQIWPKFKEQMGLSNLVAIVAIEGSHQKEVGELILGMSNDLSPLYVVMTHVPELRERAWEKLRHLPLCNSSLLVIANGIPEYADRAKALIKIPPRDANAIYTDILLARFK